MMKNKKLDVGKNSVVIDNDLNKRVKVGDHSVVIGATDSNDSTILNKQGSIAIGKDARAEGDSIAIGSGAGAGQKIPFEPTNSFGIWSLLSRIRIITWIVTIAVSIYKKVIPYFIPA